MVTEFLSYAVPSSLANFISSLYTVIDGIFVGQGVGDTDLAAVIQRINEIITALKSN